MAVAHFLFHSALIVFVYIEFPDDAGGVNGAARSVTTQREWEELTNRLLKDASTEMAAAKQLRSFVDVTLNYALEELSKQVDRTNEEFRKRIRDTQHAKAQLGQLQIQTQHKIADMLKSIGDLQIELDAKEQYLALCHNRLENRAMRPGTELCRDRVQDTLATEMQTLRQTIHHLEHMIDEVRIRQSHTHHIACRHLLCVFVSVCIFDVRNLFCCVDLIAIQFVSICLLTSSLIFIALSLFVLISSQKPPIATYCTPGSWKTKKWTDSTVDFKSIPLIA